MNLTQRYEENTDRTKALTARINDRTTSHDERDQLMVERDEVGKASADLFEQLWQGHADTSRSVPVDLDRGFAWMIVASLRRVIEQIEKELERTDLTPYMWSMLRRRADTLRSTVNILHGRGFKRSAPEPVAEQLLVAEFPDDSVDFVEAGGESEAVALQQRMIDDEAIVHRYRVVPELGAPVNLFAPVMPYENVMKPMTRRQLAWVLREKGSENLTMPEDLESFTQDSPWGERNASAAAPGAFG